MSYLVPSPADSGAQGAARLSRLYPNPAGSLLSVIPGSRFAAGSSIKVHIYSLSARMLLSQEKSYLAGTKLEIPLRGLSPGAYLLELRQGAYRELHKFIKAAK
jgi:hypothetical protein